MNTEIQHESNSGPGGWIAALIGGILNYILATINSEKVLEHALITFITAAITGFFWLVFRIIHNKYVNNNQRNRKEHSEEDDKH